MGAMFKKIYILAALLIILISIVLITQYTSMNKQIIKNKEINIEQSVELLGQKISSELKLYSQVIDYTATMIASNRWSNDEIVHNLKEMNESNPVFNLLYYGTGDNQLFTATAWTPPDDYIMKNR